MPNLVEKVRESYEAGREAGKEEIARDPEVQAILQRQDLSAKDKRHALHKLWVDNNKKHSYAKSRLVDLEKEARQLEKILKFFELYKSFSEGPLSIERPESSRLHTLVSDIRGCRAVFGRGNDVSLPYFADEFGEDTHAFVVQHDWARAFIGAEDFGSSAFRLPYDRCAFEFKISGHRVVVLCRQDSDQWISTLSFIQFEGIWASDILICHYDGSCILDGYGGDVDKGPWLLTHQQIRAVSIALEAEVAVTDVVRSPHKLNAARIKRGEPPLFDYHVVALSNRSRAANLAAGASTARRRLHFRRGHWRHYESFKTWVRWTLVGDPDLGFIEKEYRL